MMNEKTIKKLIDITDEDALKVINSMHILTENSLIERAGILGLDFKESHRKYGECRIKFLCESIDRITDGYYNVHNFCNIRFSHNQVWFEEETDEHKPSNYNRNHHIGYLKLIELGYDLPLKPGI